MSYSARHKRLAQDRHEGKHSHGGRRHLWTAHRKNRAGTDPAEVPAEQGELARQHLAAPTEA